MFIGHFAAGFAGKALSPRTSLGSLFLAAQFLDLLWPTFLLLNLEQVEIVPADFPPLRFSSYPISHSLLLGLGWALLVGLFHWLFQQDRKGAYILGLLVLSHWFLDLLVHFPDLPLYPGNSPKVGLGLWQSVSGTILVEGLLFVVGLVLYLRTTRAKNKLGLYSFWALVVFLILLYVGNIFGPAPEQVAQVAWAGQLQWLLVLWAYWADKHRAFQNA